MTKLRSYTDAQRRALKRAHQFALLHDDVEDETILADMLTDIMHWAEEHSISEGEWKHAMRRARMHHEAERSE